MQRLALTLLFLLFSAQFTLAQWTPLPPHSGYSNDIISFGSPNEGWLLATPDGPQQLPAQLFRSTDAGNSWQTTTVPFGSNPDPLGLHAISANTAHVLIRQSGTTFNLATKLFRTTNAGTTWTDITPDSTDLGMGAGTVFFSDGQNGVMGIGSTISRTTNGGQTWTNQTGNVNIGVYPNRITGKGNRLAVAGWDGTFGYQGIFMLSTDGGSTWDTIPCNRYNTVLHSAIYPATDTVYGITGTYSFGAAPECYRSFDGGTTWDTLYLQFALDSMTVPVEIHFSDGHNGTLVLQNGQIMQTTDAGNNWTQVFHAHNIIHTLSFWGGNGWVAGQNGYLASITGANSIFPARIPSLGLKLYPNPNRGQFKFEIPADWHQAQISILDIQGRILHHEMKGIEWQEMDLQGLPAGMYWLKAESESQTRIQRFAIQ